MSTGNIQGVKDAVVVTELLPHSGLSKVSRYKWIFLDERPELMYISKTELNVDHSYQRTSISLSRVNMIARKWRWAACLTLGVARRPDKSLWVFEGQHRLLAAKQRIDITELPCSVHNMREVCEEAGAFIANQTDRGTLCCIDQYKALLKHDDPNALGVEGMIQSYGYKAAKHGSTHTVGCVKALMRMYSSDAALTDSIFALCVEIHDGAHIDGMIIRGLFTLERYSRKHGDEAQLDSILTGKNSQKLIAAGSVALAKSIRDYRVLFGGGEGAAAESIVAFLNKRRRTKMMYEPRKG